MNIKSTFAVAVGILILGLAAASPALAYQRYNDGCNTCHGVFTGSTSPKGSTFPSNDKHAMHRASQNMNTACNL